MSLSLDVKPPAQEAIHTPIKPNKSRKVIAFEGAAGAAPSVGVDQPGLQARVVQQKPEPQWHQAESTPKAPKLPPLRRSDLPGAAPSLAHKAWPSSARPNIADRGLGVPRAAPIAVRAVAGLLDLALVLVALGVFIGVFNLMGGPIVADQEGLRALAFAFFTITFFYWIFYIRYIGETAGMTWLGLQVVNFDGQPPTEGQRRARALGTVLSTAAVGLGFAWAVADDELLTWHDRMSKTLVTRDEN